MTKLEKERLLDVLEAIETMQTALEVMMDNYGVHLNAMTVEHDELSKLKFDLERMSNDLGNLNEYVDRYFEENEYK
jgi:hypothetical protein